MAQGNQVTDTIILTASMYFLEQDQALHQLFHLSPQNLHRLLSELSVSQCKHLSWACATCTPLAHLRPLQCAGVNPWVLLPNAIWQMYVTHHAPFGNIKYVHEIMNTCLSFVYSLTLSGEKVINIIKAIRLVMLVMEIPWALNTDNGHAYASQQFNTFWGSGRFATQLAFPKILWNKPLWRVPTELLRSYWQGLFHQRLGEILI